MIGGVHLINANIPEFAGMNVTATGNNGSVTVQLPKTLVSNELEQTIILSVILYANDSLFVSNASVASPVVSVVVDEVMPGQTLNTPLSISFFLSALDLTRVRPVCSYYNYVSLSWLQDGCMYDEARSNSTNVVCSCSHLTNFAVLLDAQGNTNALSAANRLALGYITTIGCSISVILLGLLVLVFIFFKVRILLPISEFLLVSLTLYYRNFVASQRWLLLI